MPVYVARPGGYIGRAGDGGVETMRRWTRQGSVLGTGNNYTTGPGDVGRDAYYEESAGNLAGVLPARRILAQQGNFPCRIRFDNSVIRFANNAATPMPNATYTRKMTAAFRIVQDSPLGSMRSSAGMKLHNDGSNGTIRLRPPSAEIGTTMIYHPGTGPGATSLLIAVDLDGGLPGGKTCIVWGSHEGETMRLIGDQTATTTNPDEKMVPFEWFGSQANSIPGPAFGLDHWMWVDNTVALDPAVYWPFFFEADGAVRDLGDTGLIDGIYQPKLFVSGFDWQGSGSTIRNSAGFGTIYRYNTPFVVEAS